MPAPAWLTTARSLIGQVEDGPSILPLAQKIGQIYPEMAAYCAQVRTDTSWCGEFVAYCLAVNGIRPPFDPHDDLKSFLWADSWSGWGDGGALAGLAAEPGNVLVFKWANGHHHVTFYVADNRDGTWQCLGGNQSDQVKVSNYPSRQCVAIRRPRVTSPSPTEPIMTSSGKGSWYSQYQGHYSWVDTGDKPGSNALGVPDDQQGIALPTRSTLGQWFYVTAPNGKTLHLQQTDIGPHPRTGRLIDISAVAAEAFGYSPHTFPTDGIFQWSSSMSTPTPPPVPAPLPAPPPRIDPEQLLNSIEHLLQILAQQKSAPSPPPPPPPAPQGTNMAAALATFFTWFISVLPQVSAILAPVFAALVQGGVVGAPGATTTGTAVGSSLLSMLGVGLLNWVKTKWFTPPQNKGQSS